MLGLHIISYLSLIYQRMSIPFPFLIEEEHDIQPICAFLKFIKVNVKQ